MYNRLSVLYRRGAEVTSYKALNEVPVVVIVSSCGWTAVTVGDGWMDLSVVFPQEALSIPFETLPFDLYCD